MIARQINVNDRICSNNKLPVAEIHSEVLLMNHEKGLFYGLDDIASTIFRMIATPTRVSELCETLRGEYDAESAVIQRDVLKLLDSMAEHGLIVVTQESTG